MKNLKLLFVLLFLCVMPLNSIAQESPDGISNPTQPYEYIEKRDQAHNFAKACLDNMALIKSIPVDPANDPTGVNVMGGHIKNLWELAKTNCYNANLTIISTLTIGGSLPYNPTGPIKKPGS